MRILSQHQYQITQNSIKRSLRLNGPLAIACPQYQIIKLTIVYQRYLFRNILQRLFNSLYCKLDHRLRKIDSHIGSLSVFECHYVGDQSACTATDLVNGCSFVQIEHVDELVKETIHRRVHERVDRGKAFPFGLELIQGGKLGFFLFFHGNKRLQCRSGVVCKSVWPTGKTFLFISLSSLKLTNLVLQISRSFMRVLMNYATWHAIILIISRQLLLLAFYYFDQQQLQSIFHSLNMVNGKSVLIYYLYWSIKRFYLQRKMSLLGRELKQQTKMKQISKILYEPYKISNCSTHHLPNQLTCLHKNCPFNSQLFCRDCHLNHPTISVNKIAPKLAQAVRQEWARIMNDHKQIQQEWKHCLVNINYCLDILNEVKKQVEERSQKYELTVFNEIMNETYSMLKLDSNNLSAQMLLKNFNRLNEKYSLFVDQQKISSIQVFEQDRKVKKQQVKQASRKTKEFSESALAFSEELAKIIEEKLKYEKRVSKLKDISNLRLFTLKDLQKQKVDMQEVNELLIQLPKQQSEKEGDDVPLLLQKCQNLKSLRINNKNGRLDKNKWRPITSSFDYLKQLRELVLNIRAVDLKILTELFKQRSKAVRQIESLTLQITDEKILNVVQVYQFINTMELRNLHLTLTRDNLEKLQMLELIKGVRMGTSMTELPMNEVVFNLSKNKVTDGKEIVQVTAFFNSKAQKVKTRSVVL